MSEYKVDLSKIPKALLLWNFGEDRVLAAKILFGVENGPLDFDEAFNYSYVTQSRVEAWCPEAASVNSCWPELAEIDLETGEVRD